MSSFVRPELVTDSMDRLIAALREDQLTDWVPDALGGDFAGPDADDAASGTITVQTRGGSRSVRLASIEFRLWATSTTFDELPEWESALSPTVCGYRDATTPYRLEWQRHRALYKDGVERFHRRARADVAAFYESVSLANPAVRAAVPAAARLVMEQAEAQYGTALLPGHRWSRRIANLLLCRIDAALSCTFVRWQDDYLLFADDSRDLQSALRVIDEEAGVLGLRLNVAKTGESMGPTPSDFPDPICMSRQALWQYLGHVDDPRIDAARWKHALRRFADARDDALLPQLPQVIAKLPSLAPRVAMYLDACADSPSVVDIFQQLSRTPDVWIQARLAAVACRQLGLADLALVEMGDALASSHLPAVRGLCARLQHQLGQPTVRADDRHNRVLALMTPTQLASHLPVVETTL